MATRHSRLRRATCLPAVLFTLATACLDLAACAPASRDWPAVGADGWKSYGSRAGGWSLRYPRQFSVVERGSSAMFRQGGVPRMFVNLTGEAEARGRGIWAAHPPAGDIELCGRSGKKYVYDHYDGPVGDHTIAFVIPYRGRHLAVEFRTAGAEPTPAQQEILASLSLD